MKSDRFAGLAVAVVAIALAHPACNLLFRCGCSAFQLASHCNVHHLFGAHCPWCAHPPIAIAAAIGTAIVAMLVMRVSRRSLGPHFVSSFVAGLVGVAIGLFVAGAITVAATGYPHFLWR